MPFRYSGYSPRNPRHEAVAATGCRVEIERSADNEPRLIEAELVDFSRNGYQVGTAVPLAKGESITLKLCDEKSGLRLTLPGTVRWSRSRGNAAWLAGCQSSSEVEWETLGEMFLNHLLAREGR